MAREFRLDFGFNVKRKCHCRYSFADLRSPAETRLWQRWPLRMIARPPFKCSGMFKGALLFGQFGETDIPILKLTPASLPRPKSRVTSNSPGVYGGQESSPKGRSG
jgi:hypothetical protein